MSKAISHFMDHFRKDRPSKDTPSPSTSNTSLATTSPTTSRTATVFTNTTVSTTATSAPSESAHSSRRTSEELQEKPEVIVSDAKVSRLVREATGIKATPGEAFINAKLLAEAGVSLCCLAGYSRSKTMELIQSMPEYGHAGSRIPSSLNVEAFYRGIQQRRTDAYLSFINISGVDPLAHRLKADDIMFKQFGDRPEEYADEALRQELENWRYTWHDEITILEQHEEFERAAEIRKAIEPYNANLSDAIERVRTARDKRLREQKNRERFEKQADERRAEMANNRAQKQAIRLPTSGSENSLKSSGSVKSFTEVPQSAVETQKPAW